MISVGQTIPSIASKTFADGPIDFNLSESLAGQIAIVIGVPGAFTGVCTQQHVPAFVEQADALKAAGVEAVYCVSVNDPFVLNGWKDVMGAEGVTFVSDWNAELTKAMGLDLDISAAGLGVRSKRYMMVVQNGQVKDLQIEDNPGAFDVSGPQNALKALAAL